MTAAGTVGGGRRTPVAAVALGAALLLAALFLYVRALAPTFTDDAFITFTYARTLARSLTWGFFPGRPANTATSPLNVVLTALAGGAAGSIEAGAEWLAAALYTAVAAVLGLLSRRLFGGYAFAVAASSRCSRTRCSSRRSASRRFCSSCCFSRRSSCSPRGAGRRWPSRSRCSR